MSTEPVFDRPSDGALSLPGINTGAFRAILVNFTALAIRLVTIARSARLSLQTVVGVRGSTMTSRYRHCRAG